jgi:uncharacterized protein with HEPN domain
MPPEPDVVRIRHMADAGREGIAFCAGRSRVDLEKDRMFARALVKAIEIVGEAASKVSTQTRAELPDVPWADIVTMRHRLTHTYYDIDLDIVWNTAAHDLPPLVSTLERWLDGR